ncbi:hypothetical protein WA026_020299, partial [Henosepilachna vigintioctopunctata]
ELDRKNLENKMHFWMLNVDRRGEGTVMYAILKPPQPETWSYLGNFSEKNTTSMGTVRLVSA